MTKNWLITGGCGFIGINFISYLLRESRTTRIRILDNLSVGAREDLGRICNYVEVKVPEVTTMTTLPADRNVQLVTGDIYDPDTCTICSEGIDVILHLAAQTGVVTSVEKPRHDMETNVIGTFNMLEAARLKGVGTFIFASSSASLGDVAPPVDENKVPKPVSPYGASKLSGEAYCFAYHRSFGINTVALRFGNVYGSGSKNKSSVIAKFFRNALNGRPLEIYGSGDQTRDFIYIEDIVQAIDLAASTGVEGEVFQIAMNKEITIKEVAESIKNIVESETGKEVVIIYIAAKEGEVLKSYSDISKARKRLGYKPQFNLERGLKETFNYFKNTGRVDDYV